MNSFTHIAATNILIILLQLKGIDIFYAYSFGVFIDIDHLVPFLYDKKLQKRIRGSLKKFLLVFFDTKTILHTVFHEPFFILVLVFASLLWGYYIPLLFYIAHFILDQVLLKSKKHPFLPFSNKIITYGFVRGNGKLEYLISIPLAVMTFIVVFLY